jgi:hypothetical protein
MTDPRPRTARPVSPARARSDPSALTPIGHQSRIQDALAALRAQISLLETAWVAASEVEAARGRSRDVRIDDRGTWDRATWARYLAAAAAHEPAFMPKIKRLLCEIDRLERVLALSGHMARAA